MRFVSRMRNAASKRIAVTGFISTYVSEIEPRIFHSDQCVASGIAL